MNKQALWELLLSRNPGMEAGKAMTINGYRKMFDLIWEQAQTEAFKIVGRSKDVGVPDFLKGIFG